MAINNCPGGGIGRHVRFRCVCRSGVEVQVLSRAHIMQIHHEHSYGIIPIHRTEQGIEVFVVHQRGSAGDTLWTFPKGKEEEGETPIETALRELKEETGLVVDTPNEARPYPIEYTFVRDGTQIEKVTTYFVGYAIDRAHTLQEEEIIDAKWLAPDKAVEQLTHEGHKNILLRALEELTLDNDGKNRYNKGV